MKKLAITRPYFLTWLGTYYFIYHSDVVIALDDCLFDKKKDFRSLWHRSTFDIYSKDNSLTIPIKFEDQQPVCDLEIRTNIRYINKHIVTAKSMLSSKPFVEEVFEQVVIPVYTARHSKLIDFNMAMIFQVCEYLGINSGHIKRSSELKYSTESSVGRISKYQKYMEFERCQKIFADEGLSNMMEEQEDIGSMMALDEEFAKRQGDSDKLIHVPLLKILPKHFNILEILCEYGKGTINFIKHGN